MTAEEALNRIKSIELTHVEHYQDEDSNGEWEYWDVEESDGTVAENFAEEIKALEDALEMLRKLTGGQS